MPSYLTPDQIDDFVTLTQPHFKRHRWTDISLEYQEYESARILTEKNVVEQGGQYISFRVQTKNTGNARNTGLFDKDITRIDDVMIEGQIPWTKQTTNYSYDIDEDLFQSDRETIIREMVVREHEAMNSLAELNEENLWNSPLGPTDNRPYGIPYWLCKDATTDAEGGFYGTTPNGNFSTVGGINPTTYPRWRNWTFGYSSVSTGDMVRKTKKAIVFTKFVAPHKYPELGMGDWKYQMYTTYRVCEPLERLAETRNDRLGSDVARFMGQVTIGGIPIKHVFYLEANDTSDPIYGVCWREFRPFVKKGRNMYRHKPKAGARQHTVREVHIDTWMNYCVYNRRNMFVGSKS